MEFGMQIIDIRNYALGREFLTGLQSKSVFLNIVDELERRSRPTLLIMNFSNVNVSGSFFREVFFHVREYCHSKDLNLYTVVTGLNEESKAEVNYMLSVSSNAFLVCDLLNGQVGLKASLFGTLDDKQLFAFSTIQKEIMSDAPTLSRKYSSVDPIGPTAWNNRLKSLSEKSLIIEVKKGKTRLYKRMFEEVD